MYKATPPLLAGLACMGILAALLVHHAWPFWFGQDVTIRLTYPTNATSTQPAEQVFPAELFHRLRLWLDDPPRPTERAAILPWRPPATTVRFADDDLPRRLATDDAPEPDIFIQFHPTRPYTDVTLSAAALPGNVNLIARLLRIEPEWASDKNSIASVVLVVDDNLHLPEILRHKTTEIQAALHADREILAIVRVIPAGRWLVGHMRLIDLLIDGRPVLGRVVTPAPHTATQPSF